MKKVYKENYDRLLIGILMTAFGICISMAGIATALPFIPIGLTAIIINIGNKDILFFHDDHFVLKRGWMPKQQILYSEIKAFNISSSKKKICIDLRSGKKMVVPERLFRPNDWNQIMEAFQSIPLKNNE